MHFEFLVEGQTELTTLSILLPKIIGEYANPHTWMIHKHRGVGRLPDCLEQKPNPGDPTLLHNLPSKLRAYGNEKREDLVVVVLVDLDEREDCILFKKNLTNILNFCPNKPTTIFRIAIEELESWFLADKEAIKNAYPLFKEYFIDNYIQDSKCGTWEKLAEAVYPGGLSSIKNLGKRSVRILEQKRIWAKNISPYIDVEKNLSPSFQVFRDGLRKFIAK